MPELPRVFLSATKVDLIQHRIAAKNAIIDAGCHPVTMEHFAAEDGAPLDVCLREVESCQALVVLVAHRYGWIPEAQAEPKVKSITWLECEHAVAKRIPVFALLLDPKHEWPAEMRDSTQAIAALERGETPSIAVGQLAKFKAWLNDGRVTAAFTNPESVRAEVLHALHQWRNTKPAEANVTAGRYVEYLREATKWIDLRGLQVGSGKAHRFEIEQLYVPVKTASREMREEREEREPKSMPLERALSAKRLVIQGDAGSGKTTFLRRVAHELVRETGPLADLPIRGLPLFVRIADLDAHVREFEGKPGAPPRQNPARWIAHYFALGGWGLSESYLEAQLEAGKALLLLDGLDEAPNEERRQAMADLFEDATRRFPNARFLVTTRPAAYQGRSILAGFEVATIEPLDDEAVKQFLGLWSKCLYPENEAGAEAHRAELDRALEEKPEIREMARNPVMLTALAVVHWNDKRLPEQRAELYESVVGWLAAQRAKQRQEACGVTAKACLTALSELALSMQDDAAGRLTEVERHGAEARMPESTPPAGFLDAEINDSGIVVSRGNKLRFWHLTFQEYLAARRLAGLEGYGGVLFRRERPVLFTPEWRETMALLGGVVEQQGHGRLRSLFAGIREQARTFPDEVRCVALFSAMLRDLKPTGFVLDEEGWYRKLVAGMARLFTDGGADEVDIRDRAAAGDALPADLHPFLRTPDQEDYWVSIPGGRLQRHWAGGKECDVPRFKIGRCPVTVWEYEKFVEAGGQEPRWWTDQQRWPARPVVGVSKDEADQYCQWAKCKLPSEEQWEFAARGTDRREYAWGGNKPERHLCNIERWIGVPSPVGLFPKGRTPDYGLLDVTGNVWEWTSSKHEDWGFVLRGGSWIINRGYAACAIRLYYYPVIHDYDTGFRCSRT